MNYNWRSKTKAENCVCPFGQSGSGGMALCLGPECMAWVSRPEDKALGRCGMVPGWEEEPSQ
jgi:hypothetical protein